MGKFYRGLGAPVTKGVNPLLKKFTKTKGEIINNMQKACTAGGMVGAQDFINRQLQSGPVKTFTAEEIAEYQKSLK
jgi:hypothetical protein